MITKAVIPAAGRGTRAGARHIPKEMYPVGDNQYPIIQYVVEELIHSGIDDILIITRTGKRVIEDHFSQPPEDLARLIEENNITFFYTNQDEPKGLGHAVLLARKYMGNSPFILALGDDIVKSETPCARQLIDLYNFYRGPVIAVEEVPEERVSRYGIISPEKIREGVYFINDLIEKPAQEDAPSSLAVVGRYALTSEIFDILADTKPGINNEIQLTDALQVLCKRRAMYAIEYEGQRFDAGDRDGRIEAEKVFNSL